MRPRAHVDDAETETSRVSGIVALALALLAAVALTGCAAAARLRPAARHRHPVAAARPLAFRCPDRLPSRPVRSSGPGLTQRLVPLGSTRARLCGYAGLDPDPREVGELVREANLRAGARRRLVKTLNHLPAPSSGSVACGADDGHAFIALFAYPQRAPVAVTVNVPNSCLTATNGHKDADAVDAMDLLPRLTRRGWAYASAPWSLRHVGGHGRLLLLRYVHGLCDRLARVSIQERKSHVAIRVVLRRHQPMAPCPAIGKFATTVARLASPLGGRRLIHR